MSKVQGNRSQLAPDKAEQCNIGPGQYQVQGGATAKMVTARSANTGHCTVVVR